MTVAIMAIALAPTLANDPTSHLVPIGKRQIPQGFDDDSQ